LWLVSASAEAGFISTKQEIEIGEQLARQIEVRYQLVDDDELQQRVAAIGQSLVEVSDRKDLPYSFKVLDSDEVNAMAAPGGFVYVYRGLIELMPSDDELAGIIGHEVGHVVRRHAAAQLEKTIGMQILMIGLFGGDGLALQMAAIDAIAAGYSRDDEREADLLGYEMASRAGYNPYGMLIGLNKLYRLNPKQKNDLFSDHPETKERIGRIKKKLTADSITPTAAEFDDGSAAVIDGEWSLPRLERALGGEEAGDRAYLAAGRLYELTKLSDYSSEKYILMRNGEDINILYDDKLILELSPYDAEAADCSIEELVDTYLDALKIWNHQPI
jgi:hypothetical protein